MSASENQSGNVPRPKRPLPPPATKVLADAALFGRAVGKLSNSLARPEENVKTWEKTDLLSVDGGLSIDDIQNESPLDPSIPSDKGFAPPTDIDSNCLVPDDKDSALGEHWKLAYKAVLPEAVNPDYPVTVDRDEEL